jgi:hypothetical protein
MSCCEDDPTYSPSSSSKKIGLFLKVTFISYFYSDSNVKILLRIKQSIAKEASKPYAYVDIQIHGNHSL